MSEDDEVTQSRKRQREALKATAVALKGAEIPFALAGSYAVWARGGPEGDHDVDFVVPGAELDRAVAALGEAGILPIANTEDWLAKATWDGVTIDLIRHLPHAFVDEELLSGTDNLRVESVEMPVLGATDVLVSKVLAFDEHHCDLAPCLAIARALREQLDYDVMKPLLASSPFGTAFLNLVESLGILAEPSTRDPRSPEDSADARP